MVVYESEVYELVVQELEDSVYEEKEEEELVEKNKKIKIFCGKNNYSYKHCIEHLCRISVKKYCDC